MSGRPTSPDPPRPLPALLTVCPRNSRALRLGGSTPPPGLRVRSPGGARGRLTERDDDRAGDAVGDHHAEDVHHPGVLAPVLEVDGLALGRGAGVTGGGLAPLALLRLQLLDDPRGAARWLRPGGGSLPTPAHLASHLGSLTALVGSRHDPPHQQGKGCVRARARPPPF